MLRLSTLVVALLLLPAGSARALVAPSAVREGLEASGRWPSVASLLDSARERGAADRSLCASLLGPRYNLAGRLPDRVVVILADFPDKSAARGTFTRDWYSELLFSAGATTTGSFRDYYREISYGAYDVTGIVTGWYMMPQPQGAYTGGAYGLGQYPANAQRLAEDAIRAADPDVNFALFDNDGPDGLPDSGDDDGFVDAVLVVHAGPPAERTGSRGDLWSHQWVVHESVPVDGVRAGLYVTVAEDTRIGEVCHEFGHVLGLIDLYDLDQDGAGLGLWSLMAYGASSAAGLWPPHPDAWSRVQLGFVTPLTPGENLSAVSIPPVESAPVIYKLWTNGAGSHEYFLLENRRRTGFDASIPSEGLLIYHVDESVPSNLDEDHYRVALEQADGRLHLEQGFWYGNLGDAGDPYPGVLHVEEFSIASDPSSRAYSRARTGVAVRNIRSNGAAIVADLETFAAPAVQPVALILRDAGGDGCLAAGETGAVAVRVRNAGETGGPWEAEIVPLDAALIVEPGTVPVPEMAPGPTEAESGSAAVRALEGASGAASVIVRLRAAGMVVAERTFALSLDRAPERLDGLDDRDGWTLSPSGVGALWTRAEEGARSIWKLRPGYAAYAEASLTSPAFAARPQAVLRLAYRSALPGAEGSAADGVEVEGSLNGAAWKPLVPVSAVEFPAPPNPASALTGRSALSDTTDGWVEAVYALGEGGAWTIRFRFGSDAIVNGGFFGIDSLTVAPGLTPVAARVSCVRSGAAVRIAISLEAPERYAGAAFWRRGGAAPGAEFVRLHEGWLPAAATVEFVDERAASEPFYRVDLLLREGGIESLGPFSPAASAPRPRLALACANPFRDAARVVFDLPPGAGRYRVRVFDVTGREVAEIASGEAAGASEAVWDGRDRKGRARGAGLYFIRLEWAGGAAAIRAVRIP